MTVPALRCVRRCLGPGALMPIPKFRALIQRPIGAQPAAGRPVPEPNTLTLFGLAGAAGVAHYLRKRARTRVRN